MATLRFSFGTMGSGKSTLALQIHHNLSARGLHGLLCTHLDREGAQVSSRLGVSVEAVDVGPKLDLFELACQQREHHGALHYLVCDEAQFYAPEQADQLARVVDELDADVHALGLLTDFRGRLFPATARLLEVADERCELQVEARCWCGARATHNARMVDGVQVYEGETVVLGDVEALGDIEPAEVSYELLCRRHWLAGETGRLSDEAQRALAQPQR
ncbi:MAG: thymidine kinase [Acidimicrobiales bacterium]|nr:thymidine kinase [Acidimicrobiales bacterium]HRW39591.1 thymidine kinase [Aquihabitans sp.]